MYVRRTVRDLDGVQPVKGRDRHDVRVVAHADLEVGMLVRIGGGIRLVVKVAGQNVTVQSFATGDFDTFPAMYGTWDVMGQIGTFADV
jgi:hypothetical protein